MFGKIEERLDGRAFEEEASSHRSAADTLFVTLPVFGQESGQVRGAIAVLTL